MHLLFVALLALAGAPHAAGQVVIASGSLHNRILTALAAEFCSTEVAPDAAPLAVQWAIEPAFSTPFEDLFEPLPKVKVISKEFRSRQSGPSDSSLRSFEDALWSACPHALETGEVKITAYDDHERRMWALLRPAADRLTQIEGFISSSETDVSSAYTLMAAPHDTGSVHRMAHVRDAMLFIGHLRDADADQQFFLASEHAMIRKTLRRIARGGTFSMRNVLHPPNSRESKYATAAAKAIAADAFHKAQVEDAFVAAETKGIFCTAGVDGRTPSQDGAFFFKIFWANSKSNWSPCDDWRRHPMSTLCDGEYLNWTPNLARISSTGSAPGAAAGAAAAASSSGAAEVSQTGGGGSSDGSGGGASVSDRPMEKFIKREDYVIPLQYAEDGDKMQLFEYNVPDVVFNTDADPKEQWKDAISAEWASRVDPSAFYNATDDITNLVNRAQDGSLILLVSGFSYRKVLLNFMWILERRFGITNYGIACMDDEMCEYLEEIGKRHFAYRMTEGRLALAWRLLDAGVDLIMTDSDAVWIRNPVEHMQVADIVGQRDRHPQKQYLMWGATFCTGLLGIKSTPDTRLFMSAVLTMLPKKSRFLDQRAFNTALDMAAIDWFGKSLAHNLDESKVIDRGILRRFNDLTVALLPQDPYRRKCSMNQGRGGAALMQTRAAVIHCTGASKKGQSKEDMLRSYDLWVLPDEWEYRIVNDATRFFDQEPYVDVRDSIWKADREFWKFQDGEAGEKGFWYHVATREATDERPFAES